MEDERVDPNAPEKPKKGFKYWVQLVIYWILGFGLIAVTYQLFQQL